MNHIYLDNAATTMAPKAVLDEMVKYLNEAYINPSGVTREAQRVRRDINRVKEKFANSIGAQNLFEVYFTAGGTESNNWAIKGIARANEHKGKHIITLDIEHKSVLHTLEYLEGKGYEVTYLKTNPNGVLDINTLKAAIRPDTILITIMFVNNEIGTIQPIADIGKLAHEHNIVFHTDAVQAYPHLKIDVQAMHIDLLTASAHKAYGPKGVGVLYVRDGITIEPIMHGGSQERNRRAGTENVAGIMGFGVAIDLIQAEMATEEKRLRQMTERAINGILQIEGSYFNGDRANRMAGTFNISFDQIEGEDLLILLDRAGIIAASGSACMSGSLEESHVIVAIGGKNAHASLRISVGRYNTEADIDVLLEKLPEIIKKLRY